MNSNLADLSTFKVIITIFCFRSALSIVVCLYSCLKKSPNMNSKHLKLMKNEFLKDKFQCTPKIPFNFPCSGNRNQPTSGYRIIDKVTSQRKGLRVVVQLFQLTL